MVMLQNGQKFYQKCSMRHLDREGNGVYGIILLNKICKERKRLNTSSQRE